MHENRMIEDSTQRLGAPMSQFRAFGDDENPLTCAAALNDDRSPSHGELDDMEEEIAQRGLEEGGHDVTSSFFALDVATALNIDPMVLSRRKSSIRHSIVEAQNEEKRRVSTVATAIAAAARFRKASIALLPQNNSAQPERRKSQQVAVVDHHDGSAPSAKSSAASPTVQQQRPSLVVATKLAEPTNAPCLDDDLGDDTPCGSPTTGRPFDGVIDSHIALRSDGPLVNYEQSWLIVYCCFVLPFRLSQLPIFMALKQRAQLPLRVIILIRRKLGVRRLLRLLKASPVRNDRTVLLNILKKDRLMGLYSQEELEAVVVSAQPMYVWKHQTIIVEDLIESECFYVESGEVRLVVRGEIVKSLYAPVIVGAQGMISREPRSATVIAVTECVMWRMSRESFASANSSAKDFQNAHEAHSALDEAKVQAIRLRQINIRRTFRDELQPEYLRRFCSFRNVSRGFLEHLVRTSDVGTFPSGSPLNSDPEKFTPLFVLRGCVRIEVDPIVFQPDKLSIEELSTFGTSVPLRPNGETRLREFCAKMSTLVAVTVDLYRPDGAALENWKHTRTSLATMHGDHAAAVLERRRVIDATFDSATASLLYRSVILRGPLLLGVAFMANLPIPLRLLTISAESACEVMKIDQRFADGFEGPRLEAAVATITRNCEKERSIFIEELPTHVIESLYFYGKLSFSFIHKALRRVATQSPVVLLPDEDISFGTVAYDIHVVVAGRLHGIEREAPFVWPDPWISYFGDEARATALSRVEAIRIKRSELLTSLIAELHSSDMETLVQAMTSLYITKCGKRPVLSQEGLPEDDEDTRIGQRVKQFKRLHQLAAKSSTAYHVVDTTQSQSPTVPPSPSKRHNPRGSVVTTLEEFCPSDPKPLITSNRRSSQSARKSIDGTANGDHLPAPLQRSVEPRRSIFEGVAPNSTAFSSPERRRSSIRPQPPVATVNSVARSVESLTQSPSLLSSRRPSTSIPVQRKSITGSVSAR